MVIKNLGEFFRVELNGVKKAWIASALFNDEGFAVLSGALEGVSFQRYVIGIDLPTTVSTLRIMQTKLQEGKFEARLFKNNGVNFHPKVYLFEFIDGNTKAVVGSANLTSGGLKNNIELNVLVDDQEACETIKTWFDGLYNGSFPLDDENIKRYEQRWLAYQPSGRALNKMQHLELQKPAVTSDKLSDVNFSDRYFKAEHHRAFGADFWYKYDKPANDARKAVADVFTVLHDQIYPQFKSYGLLGLYPNVPRHLVSMYYHDPSKTKQQLNAMWLSYGKSETEIKQYHKVYGQPYLRGESQEDDKQSFINHARLQVRLEYQEIGIWILFAKNNGGGKIDRNIFKDRMRMDAAYRLKFYELLTALPEPYFIKVNDDRQDVGYFRNADTLYQFCRKDHDDAYFIIGRDYNITDPEMSATRLPLEVLQVFKKLYALYRHMRHYII